MHIAIDTVCSARPVPTHKIMDHSDSDFSDISSHDASDGDELMLNGALRLLHSCDGHYQHCNTELCQSYNFLLLCIRSRLTCANSFLPGWSKFILALTCSKVPFNSSPTVTINQRTIHPRASLPFHLPCSASEAQHRIGAQR